MTEYGHVVREAEAPRPVRRPVVLHSPDDASERQARLAAAGHATPSHPAPLTGSGTAAEPPQPSGTTMRDTVAQALTTPGQALDPTTRTDMQTRLGHDFGTVRIHTGTHADTSARQLHAAAYTTGHDVVFAAGRYRPTTPSGRTLLTHELTHVLQHDHHPPTPHDTPLHIHRSGPLGFFGDLFTEGPVEAVSRLFGEGTFTPEVLRRYLDTLRRTGKPENDYDSDNKARAVVAGWKTGDPTLALDAQLKKLLVRELYQGDVTRGDAQAVLDILERSLEPDITAVFSPGGVRPEELYVGGL